MDSFHFTASICPFKVNKKFIHQRIPDNAA